MNRGAVKGLVLRHIYFTRHNMERAFEITYWPVVIILLWGFLTTYLFRTGAELPFLASALLGAIILWMIFESANRDISLSLLFDIWGRNITNIFTSPVTLLDYLMALMVLGVIRVAISFVLMVATAFFIYQYNFFTLGLPMAAFALSLIISGWILGILVMSVIIIFGSRVGPLSWSIPFLVQVLSAVIYPVSILPPTLQAISWSLPTTRIFEGMRGIVLHGSFDPSLLVSSFLLNIVYFTIAVGVLVWVYKRAQKTGALARLD